jgi:hypothetical protein
MTKHSDPNPPEFWMEMGPYDETPPNLEGDQVWSQWHNAVSDDLKARVDKFPDPWTRLMSGFIEIANFMLKNTCGVGSNFKLAECGLATIQKPAIHRFYTLVMTELTYHFGELLPKRKAEVWPLLRDLADDPQLCDAFSRELEECRDHEDGTFSSVRAGRKLWERVAQLLHAQDPESNVTARIYYQTAPGQDLVYLVEQAIHEGWFSEE